VKDGDLMLRVDSGREVSSCTRVNSGRARADKGRVVHYQKGRNIWLRPCHESLFKCPEIMKFV
jgi:hypothetical protein